MRDAVNSVRRLVVDGEVVDVRPYVYRHKTGWEVKMPYGYYRYYHVGAADDSLDVLRRAQRFADKIDPKNSVQALLGLGARRLSYGDVYLQNEREQSTYNFEYADVDFLFTAFDAHEQQAHKLIAQQLALPAYEQVLKAGHTFNLLDARGAISVTERAAYIARIRKMARSVAQSYWESRERAGFPMAPREWVAALEQKEA